MKKVFTDASAVAHLWANKIQDEARTPTSNFFFDGDSIYSYGSHFRIAKHHSIDEVSGSHVVLFTTRDYSVTTSKHKSIVRQACNHKTVIYCFNPDGESHSANFNNWFSRMDAEAYKLKSARKPELYLNNIASEFNQCKTYADYFNLEIPAKIIDLSELQHKDQYQNILVLREQRIKEDKVKALKVAKDQLKLSLTKWRKFETNRLYTRIEFDFLRLNRSTNRIETSQGVEIPAKIALDFYQYILSTLESGGCIDCKCDKKLLDYSVKEINAKFIIVGCHKIEMREIKKAVKSLTL